MTEKNGSEVQRLRRSFQFAFEGWRHVMRTQRNARIHALITLVVVALGLWLHLPRRDWATLVLAMMVVWVAEFTNTALEAHVDLTSPDVESQAKVAKDVAAAAVLVGSVGAIIVGLLILGPPLLEKIS